MPTAKTRAAWLVILLVLPSAASTRAGRVCVPPGIFYYQPASSVFGSEAVWINPAGLAAYDASSFQLMANWTDEGFAKSWGTVVNRDQIGLAYRRLELSLDDDIGEWLAAAGMTLGKLGHMGGSYRYFRSGPEDWHHRHLWNIGLLGPAQDRIRWGAVFSNLNRGRDSHGERTDIEQLYSLSYRPFDHQLTVSVDMSLSTGMSLRQAGFIYHAEFATRGLYVRGYVDSDRNFEIGFRVNLWQHFVGNASSFTRDREHVESVFYFGGTSRRQPTIFPEPGRRLALNIAGAVPDNPPQPVFGRRQGSFIRLVADIYRAADDPSVAEMVMHLNRPSLGFGRSQELREALTFFRNRGKHITCHVSQPDNLSYLIASACDRILVPPVSQLNLVGLRAELTFYAGTLEKLGVKADVMRIGDYKTAAEQYTRQAASPENREEVNRLLDDLYDQFVVEIASGRGLSADSVRSLIDRGPLTCQEALAMGLVDGLTYADDRDGFGLSARAEIPFVRYLGDTLLNDGWPSKPAIAVVVGEGEVRFDQGLAGPLSADEDITPGTTYRGFDQALSDRRVRGLVYRIDSPGGLALAGEDVHRVVERAAQKRPLVVSMGNAAASGGYYIATPATRLFANPGTVTGSIGIYAGKPDLSGLYEKIALGKELYTRGRFAGMYTWMRSFTDDERAKFFSHLQAFYDHFVDLVAENRRLPRDSVDHLGRGRVWTGRAALANGLVDELGGVKAAVDAVAARAGVEDFRIAVFPERRPWFVLPARGLFQYLGGIILGKKGVAEAAQLDWIPEEGIYARLPYDLVIE